MNHWLQNGTEQACSCCVTASSVFTLTFVDSLLALAIFSSQFTILCDHYLHSFIRIVSFFMLMTLIPNSTVQMRIRYIPKRIFSNRIAVSLHHLAFCQNRTNSISYLLKHPLEISSSTILSAHLRKARMYHSKTYNLINLKR